jgi:hypothetical protein
LDKDLKTNLIGGKGSWVAFRELQGVMEKRVTARDCGLEHKNVQGLNANAADLGWGKVFLIEGVSTPSG